MPLLPQAVREVAHPAIRNRGTIGGSLALNNPAAEYPAVAVALGATLHLRGPEGLRTMAAEAFFTGIYGNALGPSETLEAVSFPRCPDQRAVFLKLARRFGDYAIVGLAVQGGHFVFMAVGDGPVQARQAETTYAVHGIKAAQEALLQDLDPPGT